MGVPLWLTQSLFFVQRTDCNKIRITPDNTFGSPRTLNQSGHWCESPPAQADFLPNAETLTRSVPGVYWCRFLADIRWKGDTAAAVFQGLCFKQRTGRKQWLTMTTKATTKR